MYVYTKSISFRFLCTSLSAPDGTSTSICPVNIAVLPQARKPLITPAFAMIDLLCMCLFAIIMLFFFFFVLKECTNKRGQKERERER